MPIQLLPPNPNGMKIAIDLLHRGKCIALPTETVYGLAADPLSDSAVNATFEAKQRPINHPLIVHIPNQEHLHFWAEDIPDDAFAIADKFWPGPLTLLLRKHKGCHTLATGGLDTIALRMPAHPIFLEVLNSFGKGLAAPSANPYKRLSPTSAEHVVTGLGDNIPAVLDGGDCHYGLESTILDLTNTPYRILRAGPITASDIMTCINKSVMEPAYFTDRVPGNVSAHYQPESFLKELKKENISDVLTNFKIGKAAVMSFSEDVFSLFVDTCYGATHLRKMPRQATEYGKVLFSVMHELDKFQTTAIYIELPPKTEGWQAVHNRISRALSL